MGIRRTPPGEGGCVTVCVCVCANVPLVASASGILVS